MSEIRNSKLTSVEKKRVLSKIIALFKPYGIKFPIALITGLLGSVSTVAVSVFVKIAIDRIITPMMTNATMDILPLKNLVIQMGIVLLLGIIASYYSKLTMNIMAQNITFDIRNNLFSHMQYLPMSYYDKQVKGDLMSRFNNDVDTLVDTIAYALPNGFAATATIIGVMVAMVVINRQMALLIFIFVGAMILVVRKLASLGSKYFSRQQKSIGKVNGLVEEFVEGQRVIKVFNYQKRALTEFEVVNNELKKDSFEANRHAGIMIPTVMSMGNILYVLVAIVGGYLSINKGTLTIGDIAAFLQLTKTFTMPLNEVAENITRLMQSLAGINRIFEVMEVQKEPDFGTITLRRGELRNGEFNEDINGSEYAWYK
ncbi:MAG: ABC transporter ATP-binding protein, partial [Tissierellia bacterium]|nr:ABC transporter ATP-binding protein [Tissierellia bacterium]